MEAILELFTTPFWQSLVRALIHSLWLGPLILGLMIGIAFVVPVKKTTTRYLTMLTAQVMLVVITGCLWGAFLQQDAEPITTESAGNVEFEALISPETSSMAGTPHIIPAVTTAGESKHYSWKGFLAPAWIVGVIYFLFRLLQDTKQTGKIGRSGRGLTGEISARIDPVVKDLSKRLGITRGISLKVTDSLYHPAVSGIIKPVILLPVRFLERATPKMLRAVLAHELAHIRRHDFLINVIQRILEAFLFFNPAMWLLGSMVRSERESCCDAIAVNVIGEKLAYVEGVTEWLVESTGHSSPVLSPAISGESDSGIFDRIKRILFPAGRPGMPVRPGSIMVTLLIIVAAIFVLKRGSMELTRILTDEERIAVSKKLSSTTGDPHIRMTPFELRVSVEKPDGMTPSVEELRETNLTIQYLNASNGSGTISASFPKEGIYSRQIDNGVCKVTVNSSKWARSTTAYSAPPQGSNVLDVKITLDPGEPAWFAFKDPEGKPAPHVKVWLVPGESGSYQSHQSDEEGLVRLAINRREKFRIMIRDENYAWADLRNIPLTQGETIPVKLEKTVPLTLIFRDRITGTPLTGEIRMAPDFHSERVTPVATTDQNGQALLSILSKDDVRNFCFLSDQGHRVFLPGLSPHYGGEKIIELPPPVTVSGWVDLEVGTPPESDGSGNYLITLSGSASSEPQSSHGWSKEVYASKGQNNRANFSISEVWPGDIKLKCGSREADLNVAEDSITDVVLAFPANAPLPIGSETKRDFFVRFQTPKKSDILNGKVKYGHTRIIKSGRTLDWQQGDIKDGILLIEDVPISFPFSFEIDPDGFDGFWFSKINLNYQNPTDLPAGESVIKIDVPVLSAGGIRGRILESDGSPASGIMISVRHLPEKGESAYRLNSVKNSSSPDDQISEFFASSLPLGGTYRICVHRNDSYITGPPILLTAKEPFQSVEMRFGEGVPVSGKVVDSGGAPIFDATVRLNFEHPDLGSFSNQGIQTDSEGEFQFLNVDFSNGGNYIIELDDEKNKTNKVSISVSEGNRENIRIIRPN